MSPLQTFNRLPGLVKGAIAVTASLLTIVGGVWAIDDRYVDQVEIVQSLQQLDQSIQQRMDDFEQTQKVKELQQVTERYYQLKRMQRMYPDEVELAEDLTNAKQKKESLEQELNIQ